ncbi:MAG: glycosyltransferase family 2 protein [Aestuariivirga sp.]|nr:glycosyltransferase family 2 protein [Aestuariivirga sp.]
MTVVGTILSLIAIMSSLPVGIVLTEVLCALTVRKKSGLAQLRRPEGLRVAVIVPAHDEEDGIGATVSGIAKQLGASDRLIVVADNCTDGTAEQARAAGAETIARSELQRRGKGYALDFGVKHLESDPPDVVVIVDADCRLGPGAIDALVACVQLDGGAAQAFYAMTLPPDADAKRRVAAFAWIIKNEVRPTGLMALGRPCQLMGTGMAIPWVAIRRINLATGNIVEDVKMGLDLAAAGCAPRYCPEARVESDFPATERGFSVQRQRWEAGSVATMLKIAPAMFLRAVLGMNVPLMIMAMDLMVPPLMMLLVSLLLGVLVSVTFALTGGIAFPAMIFCASLLALIVVLALAWVRFGRNVLRPRDLLELPGVFFRKLGFYLAMWRDRGAGWIRTDRK